MVSGSSKWLGTGQQCGGWGRVVPATDLCRFLFFRFLWLLWWLPVEVEEAAFCGFTPCTDPSRSSGSSWLGSFSWLWKSGEVSLSVPLPGSPGGKKHKAPKASSVLMDWWTGSLSISPEKNFRALKYIVLPSRTIYSNWQEDQFSSVQSLSCVQLFATPWITARQASLSITNSRSSSKLTSIESVLPSSHLILCCPLLLLPPIPPSIRVFSNESTLRMRWQKIHTVKASKLPECWKTCNLKQCNQRQQI